jgi:glycosyltransferase involved in cell wall biosynthesis
MILLSILIPTLPERWTLLRPLINSLTTQAGTFEVELIIDDKARGAVTTGQKRNDLIERSLGEYFVFIDDDDEIPQYYLSEIFKAIEHNPDVITFNGHMTTDGIDPVDFEIRLNHPYINDPREGKDYYLRFPNHLCPMKRELVKDFKFPDVTMGEDYAWAKQIHDSGVLKTEYVIEKNMYHYKFISKK